ncbi:GNAT family N-acetyltransferase [Candidatus Woesearchaeota archaeon]|nr:GNAT family N-acetyltransferase [Candidatus Woesearchaeota archaeon]
MTERVDIRKAGIRDYEELKQIRTEFYLWEAERDRRIKKAYVRHLGPTLAKMMRQKDKAFFMAEAEGKAIGYAAAEIQKNPAWCVHDKRGHMFNLYVDRQYRRKGVGQKLTEACLRWFKEKGIRDLMIMHYHFNTEAASLYKRYGFREYIVMLTKQGKTSSD